MTVKDSSLYPRISEVENGTQPDDGTLLKDDLKKDSKTIVITRMEDGDDVKPPPDGGARAWSIMIASFLINGIIFSVINSFSAIFVSLKKRLEDDGEFEISSKACEY